MTASESNSQTSKMETPTTPLRKLRRVCHVDGPRFSRTYRNLKNGERLTPDILRHIGNDLRKNTGNMLFGNALPDVLDCDCYEEWIVPETHDEAVRQIHEINEKYDVLVLNFANVLQPENNFSSWYEIFKELKIPCMAVGVGAQSGINYDTDFLKAPSIRESIPFFNRISECFPMATRGVFTTECFQKIGIKNVLPLGCPSFLVRDEAPVRKVNFKSAKISYNLDSPAKETILWDFYESGKQKFLFRELMKHETTLVLQTLAYQELSTLFVGTSNFCSTDLTLTIDYLGIKARPTSEEFSGKNIFDLFQFFPLKKTAESVLRSAPAPLEKGKITVRSFFEIDDWDAFARANDFSFGPRIHGNIIFLRNNKPAVLFPHDSRTRELAEFFKLPTSSFEEIGRENGLREIYCQSDFIPFEKSFPAYKRNFFNYLERNGFETRRQPRAVSLKQNSLVALYQKIRRAVGSRTY